MTPATWSHAIRLKNHTGHGYGKRSSDYENGFNDFTFDFRREAQKRSVSPSPGRSMDVIAPAVGIPVLAHRAFFADGTTCRGRYKNHVGSQHQEKPN